MKVSRLIVCAVLAAACALTLCAQQAPSGFHRVACVKLKSGMAHEFTEWAAGDMHKYAQSRANSGAVSKWYLLSSVIPQGESAQCDYIMVSIYSGLPSPPMERDDLVAASSRQASPPPLRNSLRSATPWLPSSLTTCSVPSQPLAHPKRRLLHRQL